MLKNHPIVPYIPVADVARADALRKSPTDAREEVAADLYEAARYGIFAPSAAPEHHRRARRSGRSTISPQKSQSCASEA